MATGTGQVTATSRQRIALFVFPLPLRQPGSWTMLSDAAVSTSTVLCPVNCWCLSLSPVHCWPVYRST